MLRRYRLSIPAVSVLLLFVLAGCEAALYGTVLTSGVAVNELNRHTLRNLENIDRIEVHYYPDADFRKPVVLNLVEPETIDKLVFVMNSNRSWWKNRLQIAPDSPNHFYSHQIKYLSFWTKENLVREVRIRERILMTRLGSQEITREVSQSDSDKIYHLIASAASVGWVEQRDTHR